MEFNDFWSVFVSQVAIIFDRSVGNETLNGPGHNNPEIHIPTISFGGFIAKLARYFFKKRCTEFPLHGKAD